MPSHLVYRNNENYYIIARAGDTFDLLAEETGVSARDIRKFNDMPKGYRIQAGDVLYLERKRKKAAKKYKETYGNLEVPSNYVTPDGVLLGKWIARQRYTWQNPEHSSARVTPERKAQLDELGMVWEKYDPWQERYNLAK